MTCIVGYVEKETVWMGGDSAGADGNRLSIRNDSKVFIKDNIIYGFTTSFRMGQIIRSCFNRPKHHKEDNISDYDYLCGKYMDELMQCFEKKKFSKTLNGAQEGGTFLLGYNGKLYVVENDFQVGENIIHYDSCGCGHDLAKGALFAIEQTNKTLSPEEKISIALEAACLFSSWVEKPFNILKLGVKS